MSVAHNALQAEHEQTVRGLEHAHMAAAEHLEKTFEKRLELERHKFRALQATKDDAQFAAQDALKRATDEHHRAHLGHACRAAPLMHFLLSACRAS